jgi:CelD/BcsL family acetyltransferase involved in cellulose biosynthesis
MREGVSQEVLTANSESKTDCAMVEIHASRPKYPSKPRTEQRALRKPEQLAAICNPQAIRTVVVRDIRELETFNSLWTVLARDAVDSNVYYEPWWLLPSLRYLHADRDVVFLLMFARDPDCPTGPEILCGMFPFEFAARYRGLPSRVLRSLRPKYNRLCTPLVHKEFVTECVGALLGWAEQSSESAPLVEFRFITGEGRVAQELHQQISDRHWAVFQSECTIRALFKPMPSAEMYLERALRGKRRKEFRRIENRLHEMGPTEYRCLEPRGDAKPWIASFLDLESSGWKGEGGSSLGSREETRRFFEESALEAHRRGQLMMLGLFHRDRPIALKCNFVSGQGSVAFKIAFDENYARYSPGMLLEIENLRRLHDMREIAWMDSTAEAQHFMINRLWIDRRTVETLLVSPNRAWGNFIVSSFPFLRWIKGAARHLLEGTNIGKKTRIKERETP